MRRTILAAALLSAGMLVTAMPAHARLGDTIAPVIVIGTSDVSLCMRNTEAQQDEEAYYWCNRTIRRAEASLAERAAAYLHRGVVLLRRGDNKAAMSDIDEAIRLEPAYGDAHVNRGNLMFQQGRFTDAVASYDQAITLGNSQPEIVYYNRSRANTKLGNSAAAEADLAKARAVMPVGSPLRDRLSMR